MLEGLNDKRKELIQAEISVLHRFLFIGTFISLFSANPTLSVLSIWTLYFAYKKLWKHDSFNMTFYMVATQWLFISAKVFHADILFTDIADFGYTGSIYKATLLSLIGLLFLTLGLYRFDKKRKEVDEKTINDYIKKISISKAFKIYLFFLLINIFLTGLAWRSASLNQLILPLTKIKSIIIFILLYAVFYKKENNMTAVKVILIELILGFTGFFAGFKEIFIILVLTYITANKNIISGKVIKRSLAIITILFILLLFWTSIKADYREYANGGQGDQIVRVSISDRILTITDLAMNTEVKDLIESSDDLLERLTQTKYFAEVVHMVPENINYEKGKLWGSVIRHVTMPRILFPNKPAISDSSRANKYLYTKVAGVESGTSISLGYMAESYIDFGPYLMFIPIFLLGVIYGFIEFLVLRKSKIPFIGYGFLLMILFPGILYETSNLKIVGQLLTNFITLYTFLHFFEKILYNSMLEKE